MEANENATLEPSQIVETLEGTERQEWLKTGTLPESKTEDSAVESKQEDKSAQKVADDEPKFEQPKPEAKAKKPNQMGYSELRQRVSELEARLARQEAPEPKEEPAPKAEAKVEQERPKPTPQDTDDKGKAKYKTYEEYLEDLADWKAEQKLAAFRKEQAEQLEQSKQREQQDTASRQFTEQVNAVMERYPDFKEVALDTNLPVPQGGVVEQWILRLSAAGDVTGAELLYHLAKNPDHLKAINDMNPVDAAREMVLLEAELSGEEPAAEEQPKGPNRVSKAPPPVPEVGNRSAAGNDPIVSALNEGDFQKYREAMNEKELKKHRRG
jgi:hypothetical protein